MRAGPDLTGAVATEVMTEIRVNGVLRDHVSWSVEQSIGSDAPDAVAGQGMVASTGKIEWADTRGTSPANPFLRVGGWPPKPGDRVTIDQITSADGATQTCRIFTGKIDRTPGGILTPNESIIVDDIDRLRRKVNLRPMQFAMPAEDQPGGAPSGTQLASITPVSMALAECGFRATPPPVTGYMCTHGMGTFFPDAGSGRLASTPWRERDLQRPERTIWGMAANVSRAKSGHLVQSECYGYYPAGTSPTGGKAWWWSVDMPGTVPSGAYNNAAQAILAVLGEDMTTLTIDRNGDKAYVYLTKTRDEARSNPKAVLTIPTGTDARIVCKITYTPSLRVDIATSINPDTIVTATGGIPSSSVTLALARAIDGAMGAMQLVYGTYSHDRWTRFEPNAKFDIAPYGLYSSLGLAKAHPQFNKTALELVKDAAQRMMACIWIDEDGVFHWHDIELLNTQSVKQTFKSARILDLQWDDAQTVYRRVGVKYQSPLIQGGAGSPNPYVVVWRGPGSTLKKGEVMEIWVQPESSDVDWIVVDQGLDGGQLGPRIEEGRSAIAGTTNQDLQMAIWPNAVAEKVDWGTYKIAITHNDSKITGDISLRVPPGFFTPQFDGENMPRVSAWGRTERKELTEWGASLGPDEAPDYEHDAGTWIQTAQHAQSLRVFLENRLTRPRPIITGVQVAPDARLQRGDKIRIEDEVVTGLAVTGVIFEIRQGGSAGTYDQQLSLWVTSVDTPAPKYGEVQDYYNSATYQTLQNIFGSGTYAANQANPMQ